MAAEPESAELDTWIDTDIDGRIVNWADEAPALVGYKNPAGQLLPMFITQNRPSVDQLTYALRGHVVEREAVMFPRNRRSIVVRYRIELSSESSDRRPILRWTFRTG